MMSSWTLSTCDFHDFQDRLAKGCFKTIMQYYLKITIKKKKDLKTNNVFLKPKKLAKNRFFFYNKLRFFIYVTTFDLKFP